MNIGVTSQNILKINAVIDSYSFMKPLPYVIGYSAASGVGEQPVNGQALLGARNRIIDVARNVEGLDRIISIESGIFQKDNVWLDRAVVVVYDPINKKEYVAYSDPVIFPDRYVEIARQIGLDKTTVGKVMADFGYVLDPKDPHRSITGISRQVYIEDTLKKLVEEVEMKKQK